MYLLICLLLCELAFLLACLLDCPHAYLHMLLLVCPSSEPVMKCCVSDCRCLMLLPEQTWVKAALHFCQLEKDLHERCNFFQRLETLQVTKHTEWTVSTLLSYLLQIFFHQQV